MTKKEAKEVFINRGFVNGIFDGDKWRESVAVISKWLEQEPCEDAVSRKALIERINHAEENFKADNMESIGSDDGDPFVDGVLSGVFNVREMVIQAPSVIPQEPKTGHWIEEFNDLEGEVRFTCSSCGKYQQFGTDYCYNCGAKMVKPQESEVEE